MVSTTAQTLRTPTLRKMLPNSNWQSLLKLAVVGAFLADLHKTIDGWDNICARTVGNPTAMREKHDEEGFA
jgi:hypothetical protein